MASILQPTCGYVELLEQFIAVYCYFIKVIVRKMKMCYLSISSDFTAKLFTQHQAMTTDETNRRIVAYF